MCLNDLKVLLILITCSFTTAANIKTRPPNILIFLIDDMGYSDLSAFGSQNVSTPNVDRLVSKGMKLTQWISAASICTPSRAALQTGRYPIRTGCTGTNEAYRVIPTPSNPGGLDPEKHISIARALKQADYRTGMSGKWHLGINSNGALKPQDNRFSPTAHGYDSYLGAPWTNAPMCAMDSDGISQMYETGLNYCFMTANDTVVQMPLHLENFTETITKHAVEFIEKSYIQDKQQPWFFLMSYFHVHTPLFTNRNNRGRSKGGKFGDNIEEMDDSIGVILDTVSQLGLDGDTLIFLTSDNGPYQEEGWENSGRTNIYDNENNLVGRLKGGKAQLYEGGVRMPGVAVWPGVIKPGLHSDTMVSTMDIFPTALRLAGVDLGADYVIDGKDMMPVLLEETRVSQHDVFFHYCGFRIISARVWGRWKIFWAIQKWYTNDAYNSSICVQCCNGINPFSEFVTPAAELCDCGDEDLIVLPDTEPIIFDMKLDQLELYPLNATSIWPPDSTTSYEEVVSLANYAKDLMQEDVNPQPNIFGAGTCTEGIPNSARQPCCPGCNQPTLLHSTCNDGNGNNCTCNVLG